MTNNIITAVGIDVSKEKSMIAIRHPGGEILRIHRTEQPKQQKLKTIALTHSLFRVVQEVTGGKVWRGGRGERAATASLLQKGRISLRRPVIFF